MKASRDSAQQAPYSERSYMGSNRADKRPKICVIGPMIGRTPGYSITQAECLTDMLSGDGYSVLAASSKTNRYARFVDIVGTLLAKGRRTEIMILQVYGGASFIVEDAASSIASGLRIPIIMHLHGGAIPEFIANHTSWAKRVFSRAARLVTPSRYLAESLSGYGFHSDIIPNIIDLEKYPFRLRRHLQPRIFWMRTFHPLYNPQMALHAFRKVKDVFENSQMVMAGEEKGLGPICMELAQNLGLGDSVRFPGFLNMAAKTREGDAADIYLHTNRVDNMPVSVIEAGAMGIPIVATNVGGVPHLVRDRESALIVPNEDAEAAASAMIQLLRDPDLAEKLSANGRNLSERSSWQRVGPLWMSLIDSVVGGARAGKGK